MFHLESAYSRIPRENKKEVKTASFSPPGVVGCCLTMPLGGSAGLPCQAGLRPHSRLLQFVRRLTTKELVFQRFVAPQNACVNDKKVNESMRKNVATFTSLVLASTRFSLLAPAFHYDVEFGSFLFLAASRISRTSRPRVVGGVCGARRPAVRAA